MKKEKVPTLAGIILEFIKAELGDIPVSKMKVAPDEVNIRFHETATINDLIATRSKMKELGYNDVVTSVVDYNMEFSVRTV